MYSQFIGNLSFNWLSLIIGRNCCSPYCYSGKWTEPVPSTMKMKVELDISPFQNYMEGSTIRTNLRTTNGQDGLVGHHLDV